MGKHLRAENCTPPAKIRGEVLAYGESVRKVKNWDDLRRQVAPTGKIQYDMVDNIDSMHPKFLGGDDARRWADLPD